MFQRSLNILLLLLQERPHLVQVELLAHRHAPPLLLQLSPEALLEGFHAVLGVLLVQDVQVVDGAAAREDGLVAHEGGLGAERGNHCDALAAAEGFEGLVLDVAALHDDGRSLQGKEVNENWYYLGKGAGVVRESLPLPGRGPS